MQNEDSLPCGPVCLRLAPPPPDRALLWRAHPPLCRRRSSVTNYKIIL